MNRVIYAAFLGLAGAGLVHVAVIFLIPWYSTQDAWPRLSAIAQPFQFVAISDPSEPDAYLVNGDPLLRSAACRIDIASAPARITSDGQVPFWSVAIYDRRGINVFSYNDRTSTESDVDLVLATGAQAIELGKAAVPEIAGSIIAEVKGDKLVAIVRAFQPDDSMAGDVADFLERLSCDPL
ncbi:MAG: DUF1254 domain-containing protein [Rhizobiaceae bacterium]